MVLGKSIFQGTNQLLLCAGFRITSTIKNKLLQKGYMHVYIMEEGTDDIIPEDIISEEIRLKAKKELGDKVKKIEDSFKFKNMSRSKIVKLFKSGYLKDIDISYSIRKLVEDILNDISDIGAKFLNTIMIKSKDNYFIDHSINTTVMAIIIGKNYNYSKTELTTLALGTFLHDIGKIIVEQMDKSDEPGKGNELYQEHPTFGYLILKNDNYISPMETQIVNQHHENQDGSGFPIGLKGQNLPPISSPTRETKGYIYRFAEICSVADAYDNFVLNPMGKEQLDPIDVLKKMLDGAGTKYNKEIINTLSKIIAVYPAGASVKIVNIFDPALIGYYGVVAKVNKDNLSQPVIIVTTNKYKRKIKPIMIDTSKIKFIELELII